VCDACAGSRLLVSVGNSVHYLYDTLRPLIGPTAAFTGHVMSSFFIKACFSPDGTHILSGSSDKNAYIWQASPFMVIVNYTVVALSFVTVMFVIHGYDLPTAAFDKCLLIFVVDACGGG